MVKNKRLIPLILLASSFVMSGCIGNLLDFTKKINDSIQDISQNIQQEIKDKIEPVTDDLSSRGNDDEDPSIVPVTPEEKYDFTIMYYLCASTLEYDSEMGIFPGDRNQGMFTADLREILSVDLPSNVKIIVETGGTTKWCTPKDMLDGANEISSKSLQRWEVKNHKLSHVATLNTNFMAEQNAFEDFLKWGLKDYSAKRMGVIISGHGGGMAGCAYDDNYLYKYGRNEYQNVLDTNEVALATKHALHAYNRDKFTFIGYDACVMSVADIATVDADYYEYMIASQQTEAGEGWDQDVWLSYLASNTQVETKDLLSKIAKSFVDECHSECPYYSERSSYNCEATLSVLDLSKVDNLVTSFNNYVEDLNYNVTQYQIAFKKCFGFGDGIYGLADFKEFLSNVSSSSVSSKEVEDAIDDLVIYNYYCSNFDIVPCGINIFFPYSSDRNYGLQVGKNDYTGEGMTKFTEWQKVCLASSNWTF